MGLQSFVKLSVMNSKVAKFVRLFSQGASFRPLSNNFEMTLSANRIQQLEILQNNNDWSELGSLLQSMDHTFTIFGSRLLRHWLFKQFYMLENNFSNFIVKYGTMRDNVISLKFLPMEMSRQHLLHERVLQGSCYKLTEILEVFDVQRTFALSDTLKKCSSNN
ncbi:hypothetical protein F8388_003556 [Cannabis sativa]|uniref:DNA mismatch repair protein MutS core domain-containing protein n=1 Tax=Cannabis sativa TaxID=3483 RepID=A0A7J6EMC0_CANSA|nr:hypothetical protein F8388_003556 [Cannabis sativa]